jgi:hypothetical protein
MANSGRIQTVTTYLVRNPDKLTSEDKDLLAQAKSFSRPHGTGFKLLLENGRVVNWYCAKTGEAFDYIRSLKINQTDVYTPQSLMNEKT